MHNVTGTKTTRLEPAQEQHVQCMLPDRRGLTVEEELRETGNEKQGKNETLHTGEGNGKTRGWVARVTGCAVQFVECSKPMKFHYTTIQQYSTAGGGWWLGGLPRRQAS